MITTLRIPIYLMLESDNVDRSKVVAVLEKQIIPSLVNILTNVSKSITLDPHEIASLRAVSGPFSIQVVSGKKALTER